MRYGSGRQRLEATGAATATGVVAHDALPRDGLLGAGEAAIAVRIARLDKVALQLRQLRVVHTAILVGVVAHDDLEVVLVHDDALGQEVAQLGRVLLQQLAARLGHHALAERLALGRHLLRAQLRLPLHLEHGGTLRLLALHLLLVLRVGSGAALLLRAVGRVVRLVLAAQHGNELVLLAALLLQQLRLEALLRLVGCHHLRHVRAALGVASRCLRRDLGLRLLLGQEHAQVLLLLQLRGECLLALHDLAVHALLLGVLRGLLGRHARLARLLGACVRHDPLLLLALGTALILLPARVLLLEVADEGLRLGLLARDGRLLGRLLRRQLADDVVDRLLVAPRLLLALVELAALLVDDLVLDNAAALKLAEAAAFLARGLFAQPHHAVVLLLRLQRAAQLLVHHLHLVRLLQLAVALSRDVGGLELLLQLAQARVGVADALHFEAAALIRRLA
mmetsp:Transcript_83711/g.203061  ORF Transcript_83711/g.203061 Transcript_83711/m.203061 type:complete len:451 (-) Transcript_83711:668-2020(-)